MDSIMINVNYMSDRRVQAVYTPKRNSHRNRTHFVATSVLIFFEKSWGKSWTKEGRWKRIYFTTNVHGNNVEWIRAGNEQIRVQINERK